MIVNNLLKMTKGWFIGNFEPVLYKTELFEVGCLTHKKGELKAAHYHKEAVEINLLISGSMTIQNKLLNSGDLFILDKGEIADPIFHEDCTVVVVKVPAVPGDKYLV